jgi:putative transposase
MPHRRPPRIPGFPYRGPWRYLLTTCTDGRKPHFTSPCIVDVARTHLLRTADAYSFAVPAYCFMPDHVHVLAEGLTDDSDLRRWVAMFKQTAAFAVRADITPLWQEGFHDRVLRTEESTMAVAAYVVTNPVRAGLCLNVMDYPYSGSGVYTMKQLVDSIGWRP